MKNSYQFKIRSEKYRGAKATMIFLLAVATLVVGLICGSQYIANQTNHAISLFEEKYGVQIQVGDHRILQGGEIEFRSISVGKTAFVIAGRVRAKIGINPFDAQFGKLKHIRINGLNIKLGMDEIQTIQQLFKAKKNKNSKSIRSAGSIPKIEILNSYAQIHDRGGKNIISAKIDYVKNRGEHLRFKTKTVYIGDFAEIKKGIKGSIEKGEKQQLEIVIKSHSWSQKSFVKIFPKITSKKLKAQWYFDSFPVSVISDKISEKVKKMSFKNSRGKAFISLDKGLNEVLFKTYVHNEKINFSDSLFTNGTSGPIHLSAKAVGKYNIAQKSIRVTDGIVAFKRKRKDPLVKAVAQFESTISGSNRSHTLFLDLHKTSCQTLLDSMPENLTPHINSFKLRGHISTGLELSLNNSDLKSLDIRLHHTKNNCNIVGVPKKYSLKKLRESMHLASRTNGGLTLAPIGQKTGRKIVPYSSLPKSLTVALVASEDTGFWKHKGFKFSTFVHALKRNIQEGKVAVGGSTITMQTVKNLFLNRDRTINRKIEELFLTWYLETFLSKKRILEIYASIIEFGPNLYGSEYAAYKIFGKDIGRLNLKESLFLATLLPSPVKRFQNICTGTISQGFKELLISRYRRVRGLIKNLNPKSLAKVMNTPLRFRKSLQSDPSKCTFGPEVAVKNKSLRKVF